MFFFFLAACLVSNQYTYGHLLIIGFLSKDIVASWCSSISLAHAIADNQQLKEAMLKVVLAIDQAQTGVKSLMEMCVDLLENVNYLLKRKKNLQIYLCCSLPHHFILEYPYSFFFVHR